MALRGLGSMGVLGVLIVYFTLHTRGFSSQSQYLNIILNLFRKSSLPSLNVLLLSAVGGLAYTCKR